MPSEPEANTSGGRSYSVLETEKVNPATSEIDRMSPLEIVQVINAEDAKVAEAVRRELPHIARSIEEIAARMRRGGRLLYFGAGTSGRLGALDASECPPTFNLSPDMVIGSVAGGLIALSQAVEDLEDSTEAGKADAERLGVSEADTLVGIAASGRTPYVLGAIAHAKTVGALTIGLACNKDTPLEKEVKIMVAPVVGPEVITGSTRLKAGTAQKMVLNMLSTGAMILLGKTFGNLMVDVQATNQKLHRRAVTIVRQSTGLDEDTAEALLFASGGEVKTAIIVGRTGLEPELARERLAAHSGVLRAALESMH
jgi:N-acetylmuramic acid 6-phosphate etherase